MLFVENDIVESVEYNYKLYGQRFLDTISDVTSVYFFLSLITELGLGIIVLSTALSNYIPANIILAFVIIFILFNMPLNYVRYRYIYI